MHIMYVHMCSSCNRYCNPRELELMDEVEYCIVRKNKKLAADEIKKLSRGTIPSDVSLTLFVDALMFIYMYMYSTTRR